MEGVDSRVCLCVFALLCSVCIADRAQTTENSTELTQSTTKTGHGDQGGSGNSPSQKKPNIFQRIGTMVMMIPLIMQLLSLPGALASIKLSLLKSLLVGKLALIIILFNLIKSLKPPEVVVVHQPPPVSHYDHYYSPYDYEDDSHGWFG